MGKRKKQIDKIKNQLEWIQNHLEWMQRHMTATTFRHGEVDLQSLAELVEKLETRLNRFEKAASGN